jgi:hypothetical protein
LKSRSTPWVTSPAPFCERLFQDSVSQTICPGWFRTAILLISASWVARITGANHWHPARSFAFTEFVSRQFQTHSWLVQFFYIKVLFLMSKWPHSPFLYWQLLSHISAMVCWVQVLFPMGHSGWFSLLKF